MSNYQLPLQRSMGALIACARQRSFLPPKDATTDNYNYVPTFRTPWKVATNNTDFTGTGRSPTITLLVSRGFKIDTVWVQYNLPAQVARDIGDKFAYDNLPGIHAIQQIETSIGGSIQLETVTPTAIIQRYLHAFGLDYFNNLADDWWGGYIDPMRPNNKCPYQTLTGLNTTQISSTDMSKNEVFPKIQIRLPVPSCMFFNPERYNFFLGMDSPLEFKFIFKNSNSFISRTYNSALVDLSDQLDIYLEYLNINDFGNFWNNIPYTVSSQQPYFTVDRYFETFTKSYTITNDLRINLRPSITTRLQTHIALKDNESGNVFFGTSVKSSVNNSIGAMFWPSSATLNPVYTLNVGTGLFIGSGLATSGSLQIVGWAANAFKFNIVWNRTATSSVSVTVNCTSALGSFGDLFLDLSVYGQNVGNGGFNNVLNAGMFFLCSSMTLVIQPYNPADTSINNIETPTVVFGSAKKLARGFFTFNPDPLNLTVNRHAFFRIDNIVRHSVLTNDGGPQKDGFAFDYFASQLVPQQNNANPLIVRDFIRLVKNNHPYYDLDATWPIEVESVVFEKQGSNMDTLQLTELWLYRPKGEQKHRWRAPVDIHYSYVDLFDKNKDTLGFQDFRIQDIINYIVKLKNITIMYDGVVLTDVFKEFSMAQKELIFTSLQWSLRLFQTANSAMASVRDDNVVAELNTILREEVLIPAKLYVDNGQGQAAAISEARYSHQVNSRYNPPTKRAYRPDYNSASNRITDTIQMSAAKRLRPI